jgi:biotin carboxyl carrier protein
MIYEITIDAKSYRLELARNGESWRCQLDGRIFEIDARLVRPDVLSLIIGNRSYEIMRERGFADVHVWIDGCRYAAEARDPRSMRGRRVGSRDEKGPRKLVASMPGKVVRLLAAEKNEIEAGQAIMVIEAMKMQNEIKSPKKGILQRIVAVAGSTVNAGDVLAIVE